MIPPRPKCRLAPAMIVAGVLAVMLFVYVAGYLAGQVNDLPERRRRMFSTKWQAAIYGPAAQVEALAIGRPVFTDDNRRRRHVNNLKQIRLPVEENRK